MSNLFGPHMGWRVGATVGGLLIILLGIGIIFGGKVYAKGKAQAIADLQQEVVTLEAAKVDPANDGKLIYVSGLLVADVPLSDPQTGLLSQGRALKRKVEMYQWCPGKTTTTKDKNGKKKTETGPPTEQWQSELMGSKNIDGKTNPSKFPLEASSWDAEIVKLDEFTVPASFLTKLGKERPSSRVPKCKRDLQNFSVQMSSSRGTSISRARERTRSP